MSGIQSITDAPEPAKVVSLFGAHLENLIIESWNSCGQFLKVYTEGERTVTSCPFRLNLLPQQVRFHLLRMKI